MATFAVAQSPTRSGSPTSPDRRSKEIPPPLSLTVDAPAASSPFPSPSSSFVPPPMPGAHEFANKPPSGRFVRRKKSSSASAANEEPDSPAVSKKDDIQSTQNQHNAPTLQCQDSLKEPNGVLPTVNTHVRSATPSAAVTPLTPTPASLAITPTSKSPPDAGDVPFTAAPAAEPKAEPAPAPSAPPAAESGTTYGRNTPTQMHINLPPPPSSPSQIFNTTPAFMQTPSGSGIASKHTSLSSSRPAPASPSPIASRRQSGALSLRSRHRSGLSVASTSSSSKFGTLKSPPQLPQPTKRKGEIKIRDFAFPGVDPRHKGRGPDAPKVIKKLLKNHGSLDAGSRRESGMSESSVDSEEGGSRRSSGFGSWGAFRWASKLGGAWGFGGATGSGSRTSGASGYTPSQQDFERNFDDTADLDVADSPADDDADYSDYDNDGEGDGEPEELLPGLYRALYDFDPEGTAEMGLKEGQVVKVVGRGGGVGWAIVVKPDAETNPAEGGEGNWALVPESYLRVVKYDEAEPDGDEGKAPGDTEPVTEGD